MILIMGSDDDEHGRHMLAHLRGRGHDLELFDSRWFPVRMTITFDPGNSDGRLQLPTGRNIAFHQIQSVYWRTYQGVDVPSLPDPEQAWIAHNDARSLFESMLMQLSTRWVNGWEAFRMHQTKPIQLARVVALGVRAPATILTNEPAPEHQPQLSLGPGTTVEEAERRLILMTLEHTRDNKTRAAEILGISLKTLHNKLNKLRLRPNKKE